MEVFHPAGVSRRSPDLTNPGLGRPSGSPTVQERGQRVRPTEPTEALSERQEGDVYVSLTWLGEAIPNVDADITVVTSQRLLPITTRHEQNIKYSRFRNAHIRRNSKPYFTHGLNLFPMI